MSECFKLRWENNGHTLPCVPLSTDLSPYPRLEEYTLNPGYVDPLSKRPSQKTLVFKKTLHRKFQLRATKACQIPNPRCNEHANQCPTMSMMWSFSFCIVGLNCGMLYPASTCTYRPQRRFSAFPTSLFSSEYLTVIALLFGSFSSITAGPPRHIFLSAHPCGSPQPSGLRALWPPWCAHV